VYLDWGDDNPMVLQVRQAKMRGGKTRIVSDVEKNVLIVRYSPDGKYIAFLVPGEKLGTDDLYVVQSDGREQKKLLTINKQPYRGWHFSWCPDSKRIAYVHNASKKPGSSREVYFIRIGGGEPVRLTQNQVAERCPVWLMRKS
jgi:Tol biopolymer transport system component